MSLLSTTPDLCTISDKIFGNHNAGSNLVDCLASKAPYRIDGGYGGYGGQKLFALYGDPTIYLGDATSMNWAYNNTAQRSFQVQCNHSSWAFTADSIVTGFTVKV